MSTPDPFAGYLEAGGQAPPPSAPNDSFGQYLAAPKKEAPKGEPLGDPRTGFAENILKALTGTGAEITGGLKGAYTYVEGRLRGLSHEGAMDDAATDTARYIDEHTYQPQTRAGRLFSKALGSGANPLTWPGRFIDYATEGLEQPREIPPTELGDIYRLSHPGATMKPGATPGQLTFVKTMLNAPMVIASFMGGETPVGGAPPPAGEWLKGGALEAPAAAELPPPAPEMLDKSAGYSHAGEPISAEPAPPRPAYSMVGEHPIQEAELPPPAEFPERAPAVGPGQSLPDAEVQHRAQLAREVGIDPDSLVRKSALEGDAGKAHTDVQSTRFDTAGGVEMKARFKEEREALRGYAEKGLETTGGSEGLSQAELMARDQVVLKPLQGLRDWFNNKVTQLYNTAKDRAAGQAVDTPGIHGVVADEKEFLGTGGGKQLLEGVKRALKDFKMVDAEGNPTPTTVEQVEGFRKYLNRQWTPETNHLIRSMKAAIDDDVFSHAGEDVYGPARAMRQLEAQTLENPKGIAQVMDADGINRRVPVGQVTDHIWSQPPEQFAHIVETLKQLPPELQPLGDKALAELKGHFWNRVLEAGNKGDLQWNARAVGKILRGNNGRMPVLFDADELGRFGTLNDAGNIFTANQSYPGAAAQFHNIEKTGIAPGLVRKGATGAGATVGGFFGGAPGAAAGALAGSVAGEKAAAALESKQSLRAAQRRMTRLRDVLPPEAEGVKK